VAEQTHATLVAWARSWDASAAHQHSASASDAIHRLADTVESLQANPRDEHHTMKELYDYRMLYNALAFNAWAAAATFPVVKSWRHSDGELCFGGGWFIVVATLPTGQVSNHYSAEHWPLFQVPEVAPPEYDGHTPEVAAQRMRDLLATPQISDASPAVTVNDRGFHGYADFETSYGQRLQVYESSAASGPHVWVSVTPPESEPTLTPAHLDTDQARALRDALDVFLREIPHRWRE